MTPRFHRTRVALAALASLAIFAATGWAGDFKSQSTIGGSFFAASPPCPVNQFPTFESITPIPRIVNPSQQNVIPMFCQIQVTHEGKGVNKAKGTWESELFLIDNDTGTGESIFKRAGRFRTRGPDGLDSFDFDIPAEIFADGFESGDVSAWSHTETSFTNKKRASTASVSCQASASRAD